MPQHDIQIKVSTDAQLTALKATLNDTKKLRDSIAAGGRATDALDSEIAELQRTMAQREFDLYENELQRLIATEKAAGNSTDDLERRLAAIQNSTPHTPVSKLNSELRGILSNVPGVNQLTSALNGSTLAVGTAIALTAKLAGAYREMIRAGIAYNSALETQSVKFETLLGSADAAETRIRELARFAATTPFDLQGIAEASSILETLTRGALSTGSGLRSVGDAAAVANVPIADMATTLGRAYDALTNNRAAGESLQRLQELGVLSGEARTRIEQLQQQAQGTQAWDVLSAQLARFDGQMAKQSATFEGLQSTFRDLRSEIAGDAAAPFFDRIKSSLADINTLLSETDMGSWIGGLTESALDFGDALLKISGVYPVWQGFWKATGADIAIAAARSREIGESLASQNAALLRLTANAKSLADRQAARLAIDDAILDAQHRISFLSGQELDTASQFLSQLEGMRDRFDQIAGKGADILSTDRERIDAIRSQNEELALQSAELDSILDSLLQQAKTAEENSILDSLAPADALARVQSRITAMRANLGSLLGQTADFMESSTGSFHASISDLIADAKTLADDDKSRAISYIKTLTELENKVDSLSSKLKLNETPTTSSVTSTAQDTPSKTSNSSPGTKSSSADLSSSLAALRAIASGLAQEADDRLTLSDRLQAAYADETVATADLRTTLDDLTTGYKTALEAARKTAAKNGYFTAAGQTAREQIKTFTAALSDLSSASFSAKTRFTTADQQQLNNAAAQPGAAQQTPDIATPADEAATSLDAAKTSLDSVAKSATGMATSAATAATQAAAGATSLETLATQTTAAATRTATAAETAATQIALMAAAFESFAATTTSKVAYLSSRLAALERSLSR